MFEPAADDDRPGRRPPPADDRLWRHPSEVARAAAAAASASGERPTDPRLSGRRFSLSTVVVAGSLGALAMLATLATFGMVTSITSPTDDDDNVAAGPQDGAAGSTALAATAHAPGVVAVRLGGDTAGVIGAALVLDSPGTLVTTLGVDVGSPVAVETGPGVWTTAVVDGTDPATGVSLLRVRGATGAAARATSAPRVGQAVTMLDVGPTRSSPTGNVNKVIRTNGPVRTPDVSRVGLTTLTSPRPCGPSDVAVDHDGAVIALVADIDDDDDDQISYAVPAELALRVGRQLDEHGVAAHGRIDAAIAPDGDVLTVAEITPESRAAAADLRHGDEVTTIDSTPVGTSLELDGALVGRSAGDWVHVGVRRDHRMMTLTVQLAGPPAATLVSTTTLG